MPEFFIFENKQTFQIMKEQSNQKPLSPEELLKLPKEERHKILRNMTAKEVGDFFSYIFVKNLKNPDNHDRSN